MSITNINDYLNSIGVLSTSMTQPSVPKAAENTSTSSNQDSYISSISDSDEALSCDTYNDILQKLASALSTSSTSESSSNSTDAKTSSNTATDGTFGNSSDKSSNSTSETEVVTLNGVTYLQTTTTENGVETVTRTVISVDNKKQTDDALSLLNNKDSQMQTTDLL